MEQEIKLFVNNYELETSGIKGVSIKKQMKDAKEFTKRKTSFSKPISVIQSKHNSKIFGSAFNINQIGGFDRNSRPIARIEVNNQAVLEGFMKLDEITHDYYKVIVYHDEVNLSKLFGETLISGNADATQDLQIQDTSTSFNITRNFIRNNYMNSEFVPNGSNVFFGRMGFRAYDNSINDFMMPALPIREILIDLFHSVGKTLTLSPEIEKYITSMYIPYNKNVKNLCNVWDFGEYEVFESEGKLNTSAPFEIKPMHGYIIHKNEIGIFPASDEIITIGVPGTYEIEAVLQAWKTKDGGGDTPEVYLSGGLRSFKTVFEYTDLEIDFKSGDNTPFVLVDKDTHYSKTFKSTFVLKDGEYAYLYLGHTQKELDDDNGIFNMIGNVYLTKVDGYYNGERLLKKQDLLPIKYKKKDFFEDIVKMFNGMVEETSTNNLYLSTYREFAYGTTSNNYDWTDKIDISSISLKTIVSQQTTVSQYKFKDSVDLLGKDYKTRFNKGLFDLTYDIDKSKSAKDVQLSIPAPISYENKLYTLADEDKLYNERPAQIVFVKQDLAETDEVWGLRWKLDIDRIPAYTYIMKDDASSTDNLCLSWSESFTYDGVRTDFTNGNLYNRFYKGYDYSDPNLVLVTAKMKLTPRDIANVTLKDNIYLNMNKFGSGWFKINEIKKYNVGSYDLVEVEFAQINKEITSEEFISSSITLPLIEKYIEVEEV